MNVKGINDKCLGKRFILHITENVEDTFLMTISIFYENNSTIESHDITK